jgi:hypothetical protein
MLSLLGKYQDIEWLPRLADVLRMRLTHVSAPASENSADAGRVGSRAPSVHRGEGQR